MYWIYGSTKCIDKPSIMGEIGPQVWIPTEGVYGLTRGRFTAHFPHLQNTCSSWENIYVTFFKFLKLWLDLALLCLTEQTILLASQKNKLWICFPTSKNLFWTRNTTLKRLKVEKIQSISIIWDIWIDGFEGVEPILLFDRGLLRRALDFKGADLLLSFAFYSFLGVELMHTTESLSYVTPARRTASSRDVFAGTSPATRRHHQRLQRW